MTKFGKTTCQFYNGTDSVTVNSSLFRTIRGWASTGIPKDAIKGGRKVYVAKTTLERIKKIA